VQLRFVSLPISTNVTDFYVNTASLHWLWLAKREMRKIYGLYR